MTREDLRSSEHIILVGSDLTDSVGGGTQKVFFVKNHRHIDQYAHVLIVWMNFELRWSER